MADETAAATPAVAEQPETPAAPTSAATPTVDATGQNSGQERTFTQADLDRIIEDRLRQERTKGEKAAAKAKADAETAALVEQGKYKEIAERLQAERDAAQAEARGVALKLMQRDVAAKTNLPAPLAERLRGETVEEMEADAKAILAALPKPAAPNINAPNGVGGVPATGQKSEAEIMEMAARYHVSPALLKQQYGMS